VRNLRMPPPVIFDDHRSSFFWQLFWELVKHDWGCLLVHGLGGCTCRARLAKETEKPK
jgi:hypothetical protein